MHRGIIRLTCILSVVVALLSQLLFHDTWKENALGVLIGAMCGLLGFAMIVRMSACILPEHEEDAFSAYSSQLTRYLIYGGIFAVAWLGGVHIIALLIGFLLHKASILIYVCWHRKEDD